MLSVASILLLCTDPADANFLRFHLQDWMTGTSSASWTTVMSVTKAMLPTFLSALMPMLITKEFVKVPSAILADSFTIVSLTILFVPFLRSTFRSKRPKIKPCFLWQLVFLVLLLCCCDSNVHAAAFTTANIGQSTPLAGAANTITVTIVTDVNLLHSGTSVVTITGLTGASATTGAIALIDKGNDGETVFWDGITQGKGAWDDSQKKLTLTVFTGQTLTAATPYTFAFVVTNPGAAQDAATPNIAASGTATFNAAMTQPNSALLGVINGANPLIIVVPTFGVKSIRQSTPVAGAANTMTVTLTANVNLEPTSVVTITGLTGAVATGPITLAGTDAGRFSDGTTPSRGVWDNTAKKLTLRVQTGQTLTAATTYTFAFVVTNPGAAQDAATPSIAASGTATFDAAAMTKPGTALFGVANGYDPLLVVSALPTFRVATIQQSTPVVNAANTMTVTLTANVDLGVGSLVTITGLTGAVATGPITLAGTDAGRFSNGATASRGVWDNTEKKLTLTVHTDLALVSGTPYTFTFPVTNPGAAQSSPAVSVSATIGGSAKSAVAMTKPGTALFGLANGYDPLLVVSALPTFRVATIQQSTPVVNAANTMTVTLTANVDLGVGSLVTITGLTGAVATGPITLAGTDAGRFSNGATASRGAWDDTTKKLTLTVHTDLALVSGTPYTFTFPVTNPGAAQESPAVSVSATIGGDLKSAVAMTKPGTALFGLANGYDPLLVVSALPTFRVATIQQSTPVVNAANTMTVTLTANVDLGVGSLVTITGLTGAGATGPITLAGTDAGRFSNGATASRGAWDDTTKKLTLTVHTDLALVSGTPYTFTFTVTNPDAAQSSPAVSVSATIGGVPKSAVAMTKPGTALFGVANGYDPLLVVVPTFRTANIGQSTPLAGAANTITVTIVTDVNLLHSGTSVVTITGLTGASATTGAIALIDKGNDGETVFWDGTTQGKGAWDDSQKKLTLTVFTGQTLTAATPYTFAFVVTNPADAPAAATPNIAASGTATFNAAMTQPNSALLGVINGANPLIIVVPTFGVKSIRQSTPVAGAANTMTVTLTANVNLEPTSVVTITGLTGAVATGPITLAGTDAGRFSDGTTPSRGVWDNTAKKLTLRVQTGQTLTAATPYTFAFVVTNPGAAQDAATPSIAASGTATFDAAAMTKPGTALFGVANGYDPLLVVSALPTFRVATIQQSTPVVNAANTMTVTLTANVDLGVGSLVTITGLTGAVATGPITLAGTDAGRFSNGATASRGAWDDTTKKLTLTVHTDLALVSGTPYTFTFPVTNPGAAQESPAVSVSATIGGDLKSAVAMTKPGTALFGLANGYDPLLVVSALPTFRVATIQQSTPVVNAANTMTVTLTANVDLGVGSLVTITGLTGAVATGPITLAGTDAGRFSNGATASRGAWDDTTKKLTLTVHTDLALVSGTPYTFAFTVTNPGAAQESPAVSVSATIGGDLKSAVAMTKPGTALFGLANGYDPLLVVSALPTFRVATIQQSTPVVNAANTMTVTLTANVDLGVGSLVTITGLTGAVATGPITLAGTDAGRFSNGATASRGAWDDTTKKLTLTVHTDLALVSGTPYTFTFTVTNPDAAQSSPAVSVSATIGGSAKSAVAMTKPGTALFGVANGYDPLLVVVPTFRTANIGQSTPLAGAANTITVTIVTDVNLLHSGTSVVTITGLTGASATTGAIALIDKGNDGETVFWDGITQGKGAWDDSQKKLTLTVFTGQTLTAATPYTFAFVVTNPADAPAAATPNIAASGTATFNAAMTQPNSALLGVINGANPLIIVVPTFGVKSIRQSTPVAGAANTMTVTLTANVNLEPTSVVTITGLTGAVATGPITLAGTDAGRFSDGTTPSRGVWDNTAKKLTLRVQTGQTLTAATPYTFAFVVTNPGAAQDAATPSIAASGTATFDAAAMTKPGTALFGVANGYDPLLVVSALPTFRVATIQQSTPVVNAANTMTVTLTANVDLGVGSLVTITGLTGAVATGPITLAGTDAGRFSNGATASRGAWDDTTKKLTLTVHTDLALVSGTPYTFTFPVTNPGAAQSSPAVSVSATIGGSAKSAVAMTKPGTALFGLANGYDPLLVVSALPTFRVATIQQSTPVVNAANTMTVTLTANVDLGVGSLVTITGLTGAVATGPITLAGTDAGRFSNGATASRGAWDDTTKKLTLTVHTDLALVSGTPYTFAFTVTNPGAAQESPAVSVSATIGGDLKSAVAMTKPGTALFGLANGYDPLLVVSALPTFRVATIQQSTPVVNAANTMTVTLTANVDLGVGSLVTITGLTGAVATGPITLAGTDAGRFSNGATASRGAWDDTTKKLTLTVHTDLALVSGTPYTFTFTVTNPDAAQSSPAVSVSATIGGSAKSAVAMTKPGTALFGVANGYDPLLVVVPTFRTANIGQSTPLAGAANTITVTIVTDVNLLHSGTSVVTITGLTGASATTGAIALIDKGNDGETVFWDGTTQGKGAWDDSQKKLTLTVFTGQTLTAATPYTFAFVVTNPADAPAAATPNIAASGTATFNAAMTQPNSALLGVINGANPLIIVVPTFGVKSIRQSTPVAGAANTMTVTLTANVNLEPTSVVTITGLTGAVATGPITLAGTDAGRFSDGTTPSRGVWDNTAKKLTLTVHTGQTLTAATPYTFAFVVTNPGAAQDAATPNIAASGTATFNAAMTQPNSALLGVINGANPLIIVVPTFSVKSIQQSTPVAGAANTMTVTLTANVNLEPTSVVTITGLTGAVATGPITLAGTDAGRFSDGTTPSRGVWDNTAKKLTLTVQTGQTLTAATPYTFAFVVTNPGAAQDAATPSIAASGTATFDAAAMTKPGTALFGLANGYDPLLVVSALPTFRVATIQQSTPVVNAANTMTVTLTANVDLGVGSLVTITGLTGAVATGPITLAGTDAGRFSNGATASRGAWDNTEKKLTLTVHTDLALVSGTPYTFTFPVTNPGAAQSSPAVSVSATIGGSAKSAVAMTKPGTALFGLANGYDPLLVVSALPTFRVATIQQSTPVVNAANTMTVTLTANVDLGVGSLVTITGLTGAVATGPITLAGTDAGRFSNGATSSRGAWDDTTKKLTLTVHTDLALVSGTPYTFTFPVTNPGAAQESPAVSVSATIGGDLKSAVAMTKPGTALFGLANGYDPLLVVSALPTFRVATIQQSTPVVNAANTMTVTLTANVDLGVGSLVTITGLTGVGATGPITLAGTDAGRFSVGTTPSRGAWDDTTKKLTLTVHTDLALVSGTPYTFTFTVTNPDAAQSSPAVSVSATIGGSAKSAVAMTKPGTALFGVANGYDPLLVVVPTFRTANIGQSTPLAGAANTITVTIVTDVNLLHSGTSVVTITGLTGASATTGAIALIDKGNDGETVFWDGTTQGKGAWDDSQKKLTLTVFTGQTLTAATPYTFAFVVTNPADAPAAATPNIAASGTATFNAAMTQPNSALLGVINGANPLIIVVPTFSVKSIQQSTPVAGAANTMTVTLTANVNLEPTSVVTITGLTGAVATGPITLAGTDAGRFSDGTTPSRGVWDNTAKKLTLTVHTGLALVSGTPYTFTFTVTNPTASQSSPAVSVSATLASSVGSIAVAAMTKPGTALSGVANGYDPLLVTVPSFMVQMKVELPYTKASFDDTAQDKFKSAVASAVGAPADNIFIKSVTEVTSRRVSRKLLAVSVQVEFYIVVTDAAAGKTMVSSGNLEMEKLNSELAKQVLR
jgi:ABC-type xylose transport system permease subunit